MKPRVTSYSYGREFTSCVLKIIGHNAKIMSWICDLEHQNRKLGHKNYNLEFKS